MLKSAGLLKIGKIIRGIIFISCELLIVIYLVWLRQTKSGAGFEGRERGISVLGAVLKNEIKNWSVLKEHSNN